MGESSAVPGGAVYRQLFDAQVQLSRCLLAGNRDQKLDPLSPEDRSPLSRLHSSCSWRQREDDVTDDVTDGVSGLPDAAEPRRWSSAFTDELMQQRGQKHLEALQQLDAHLVQLSQLCEAQLRTIGQQLLAALRDSDQRLEHLEDRLQHLEGTSLQEVFALWEEVEEEGQLRRARIQELDHKLNGCERQRSNEVRAALRQQRGVLEDIGFLPPADIHRLIHAQATMLNQSLLANRRSAARLLLLLREQGLQRRLHLHRLWGDGLDQWRAGQTATLLDRFRALSSREAQPVPEQHSQQQEVAARRCDIITSICSLAPPTCSAVLVSEWFSRLEAANQQMDDLHADLLQQLRSGYEQARRDLQEEAGRCKEALSALQLSEQQVEDIFSSQLLPLIGQRRSRDEERLAALEACRASLCGHAAAVSSGVLQMLMAAALLWETHQQRLIGREQELQRRLDELRQSQEQALQRKRVRVEELLSALRQEASEEALRRSLERAAAGLKELELSCMQAVSSQLDLLDSFPSVLQEELLSYSSSVTTLFQLSPAPTPVTTATTPTPPAPQSQVLSTSPPQDEDQHSPQPDPGQTPGLRPETPEGRPISCQREATLDHASRKQLAQAASSLLQLSDVGSRVSVLSSGGVAYCGPAFRCPAPSRQGAPLTAFPADLLTHTLSRTRVLMLDHLERHHQSARRAAVAMVTDRKEAALLERDLQLQQLKPEHIRTHIYLPRLAELQRHRRQVEQLHQGALQLLGCCRSELQRLQDSISTRDQQVRMGLARLEQEAQGARSSRGLEAVSTALQKLLDRHAKQSQNLQSRFRQTVQMRLDKARDRTTSLMKTFRMFSEGGDFAPQEVKLFQRRLRDTARRISLGKDSIHSELEAFEAWSIQQVEEASLQVMELLSSLKSELIFTEKVQKKLSSTQIQLKAQASLSIQQQSGISSRLEALREQMEDWQVCPDQLFSAVASLHEEIRRRSRFLELDCVAPPPPPPPPPPPSGQVQPAPPGLLQPSRTGLDLLEDPAVDIIRSLGRFCSDLESGAEGDQRGGQSPGRQQRGAESDSTPSWRRGRTGRTDVKADRRLLLFGSKPEAELSPQSFRPAVRSVLWNTNSSLLQLAEEFYQGERLGRLRLLPESLDQWADSMQQRLLGYQQGACSLLSCSRAELLKQLGSLGGVLSSLPAAVIRSHQQLHQEQLGEEVGGARRRRKELLEASKQEQEENFQQLRARLSREELTALNQKEEHRQQQLEEASRRSQQELQACLRARGEQFFSSLSCLSEKLLDLLDQLLPPAVPGADPAEAPGPTEDSTVTTETAAQVGQTPTGGSSACSPPSVTVTTTTSSTTDRFQKHKEVIQHRDASAQRFQLLLDLELSVSEDEQQRLLQQQQSWSLHWRQQLLRRPQ